MIMVINNMKYTTSKEVDDDFIFPSSVSFSFTSAVGFTFDSVSVTFDFVSDETGNNIQESRWKQ